MTLSEKSQKTKTYFVISLLKNSIKLKLKWQKTDHQLPGVEERCTIEGLQRDRPFVSRYVHYLHCGDGFLDIYMCQTSQIILFKCAHFIIYLLYLNKAVKKFQMHQKSKY